MIRKLRMKFVAACMTLVTAVLAAVFFSIFMVVKDSTANLSRELLQQVVQQDDYYLDGGSIFRPELSIDVGGNRVLLPYFTVNVWLWRDGGYTAEVTGGTYANLDNTEALTEILTQCLEQEQQEGTIPHYQLRYLRVDNGLYQQLAFVDMSMERAVLAKMIGAYLTIATGAFLLLMAISVLLSHWATRPVEKAWSQQRQFLSDASHELKTPLTVILSNAEMLDQADLPEKPARWSDNIHSEAQQMKRLVEQMLSLARADNMAVTPVFSDVSLSEIAADCALAFEPVAFEAGKPLEYDLAEEVLVSGDANKLRQVVSGLLDNAIKYGGAGGTICLQLRKTERQAKLTVSNPGVPIPPEQLKRLFERFYRADVSRGEQTGFGLGLPIAAAIAKEHKGSLKAESDPQSTRFTLTLPLLKQRNDSHSPLSK